MKRFCAALIATACVVLVTQTASAADMSVKAPIKAVPAPDPLWTGFYVGANAGYGWGNRSVDFDPNDQAAFDATCGGGFGSTCAPPAAYDVKGGLGGLQAGYNWQFQPYAVVGIETDFDWSGIRGSGTSNFLSLPTAVPPGNASFVADQNVKWFGTLRGRLGWLPTNNFLVYGTAGLAYGRVDQTAGLNAAGNLASVPGYFCTLGVPNQAPVTNCFYGNASHTATGWTAGGGFEFFAWNNISVKFEYLYVDLGTHNVNVVAQRASFGGGGIPSSFTAVYDRTAINVARVGINYKFN